MSSQFAQPPATGVAARRQRRRLRPTDRREELIRATQAVVERWGYQGATVPRVVAAADSAHGSFYRYFANIDEAFLALLRRVLAPLASSAFQLEFSQVSTAADVEAVLRAFYHRLAAELSEHAVLLREFLFVGQRAQGPVGEEVSAFLRSMRRIAKMLIDEHKGRPPFRATLNSAVAASAIVGMVLGAVHEAAEIGDAFEPEAWATEMARFEAGALVDPIYRTNAGEASCGNRD